MNEEIKIIIKAVTDSAKKGVNEVKKELEGLSKSGKSASGSIGASMKAVSKSAAIAVAGIAAVTGALVALGKSTMEYRQEQAKLIAGFEAAGASAQQASETYNQLFRFLGKSDVAVEAANHLAKITTNQKDLAQWTKIAQGVYATFGDSLPIEGLTESANETLRVGKVTGNLADALNWAGVSEDEFNAKLAATNSYSEREAMLRSTLNGLYSEAANIYERNNSALLAYNESQARLDSSMARAGAAVTPLMTALNNLGSAFFNALTPALNAVIPIISSFVNWIAKGVEAVLSFFSALTGKSSSIKAISQVGAAAGGVAKNLGSAASGANKLGSGMGDAQKAAGGAKKAVEEVKRSTQGFDELNILSSDKASGGSSGGSGGGGGGGSSAPGYASPSGGGGSDSSFSTEIEETGGVAESIADKIKNTFSGLADVFAPSIQAWSGALETVKQAWNEAKPHFINGATEIKNAFVTLGTYLGTEFVPNVVNSFSVNLAPVFGDLAGFMLVEFSKLFEDVGKSINTVTNDVVIPGLKTIEKVAKDVFNIIGGAWSAHGSKLLKAFSDTFTNIKGHIENFYNSSFKPIWDKVLEVFNYVWDNGLKPLVDKFANAALIIGTELLTLYNEVIAPVVDWIITKIFPIIVNVVNNIIKIVGDILVAISNIVGGVIDVITGIIQFVVGVFTGDWSKAWDGIKNIFSGFKDIFSGIIDVLLGILKGLASFIVDVVAAAFKIAWELIKGVWSVVTGWFKAIWDGICAIFAPVGQWFSGIFSGAWGLIQSAWSGVVNWFSGIWTNITGVFSGVGSWFQGIFSGAWELIKGVFANWGSFFSGLWDSIKTTFSNLGTSIASAIGGAVKSGINGVISMIQNTINGAINLINGAIGLINKLPGVSVGRIGKLSLPRLAKGGIVDSATIAMIGERGKEAVVPLENNTEWMDKLADKLSARNQAPTKVILKVGEKELGWATIDAINGITEQTGGLQLAL